MMKIFLKYSKSEVNLWGFASDFLMCLRCGSATRRRVRLWWPVVVLLLAGIICIIVGGSFSRTKRLTNRSKMDMVMKEKTTKIVGEFGGVSRRS